MLNLSTLSEGFSTGSLSSTASPLSSLNAIHPTNEEGNHVSSRRMFTSSLAGAMLAATASMVVMKPSIALAADENSKATIYRTGKAPIVPGQKPQDKNDVKGTKKDPNFLRSIADCRNQCLNTAGPDGLAKPMEDCLSECQDICCTTYEQCTFAITPRL